LILSAIRKSSEAVYERHWSHFTTYLRKFNIPVQHVSETTLVKFFSYQFEKHGFKYAKLQSIRSALVLPLRLACGLNLGKLILLKQTLAGIRRVIPPARPPLVSWDLDTVLTFLQSSQFEPLGEKSPEVIFSKTLFLVALATGLRVSELGSLGSSPAFLQFHPTGCAFKFLPVFLAKHEYSDKLGDNIWLPSIAHANIPIKAKVLCPVRALNIYIEATRSHRDVLSPVFLHPSLHTSLSPSVLSRFLARTIRRATMSSSHRVSAHDVRAVAAALQWRCNQNWDKFIRTYSRGFHALA
jgi:integrase